MGKPTHRWPRRVGRMRHGRLLSSSCSRRSVVRSIVAALILVGATSAPTRAQSSEDVLALQSHALSTWMTERPEYAICLQPVANESGWPPGRDNSAFAAPSDPELDALRQRLDALHPDRLAPYCVVTDDGAPATPLDLLRVRAARRTQCEERRERVMAAETVEEQARIMRETSTAPCYPNTHQWMDPYGRPAAFLLVTSATFRSASEGSVLFLYRIGSTGRRYRFCDYTRTSTGWELVEACEAVTVTH